MNKDSNNNKLNSDVVSTEQESIAPTLTTDDQETAIGFSNELDQYQREILDATFQNKLTMSKNIVKYNYSKLKNKILSYSGVVAKYDNDKEIFTKKKDTLFIMELKGEQILLYTILASESLDKKVYPHRTLKTAEYAKTPTVFTIKTAPSVTRTLEIIDVVMVASKIEPLRGYTQVAYASQFPVNPNAVIRGEENLPLVENRYLTDDYSDIYGELTKNIMDTMVAAPKKSRKKVSGGAQLETQRQTAKTIKGAVSLTEPIVYFYNLALDNENNPSYISIQQVLNDRYLGKLIPPMYFAIAEGSDRIEELNFLALAEAVSACNDNPNTHIAIAISCRLLIKEALLTKLIENAHTTSNNLIIALDCALLEALGDIGRNATAAIKNARLAIMLDNTENAGMQVLTNYEYDYIRFDGRYYKEVTDAKTAHLKMITGFAKTLGITTTSTNVANQKEAVNLIQNGVDIIEGDAIATPKRLISLALKEFKRLPPVARN